MSISTKGFESFFNHIYGSCIGHSIPLEVNVLSAKSIAYQQNLFWGRIRKEEWEYSCLICKTFSEKTQGGSSNHWGYLETTTTELRACALSIKPFGSMTPSLSLENWENVHRPYGHLSASGT